MTEYVKSVLALLLADRQREAVRVGDLITETETRLAHLEEEAQTIRQQCLELEATIEQYR